MLRIIGRNPDRVPMERMGEYISEFAKLLGSENSPTFRGIKKASTGLKAHIPSTRVQYAHARIIKAKDPNSANTTLGKCLHRIEGMLGADLVRSAELLNSDNNVIYLFNCPIPPSELTIKISQRGSVDGVVVGILGLDDTSHLRLQDSLGRVFNLVVKDAAIARDLATHFKGTQIRLNINGTWERTEDGWLPESGKCHVESFYLLDESPLTVTFSELLKIPNNGWSVMHNPIAEWSSIRGID